ncbi:MAG: hypothetical protein GWP91_20965 [Rhodobacterales bacterium]|nr:hypothetical protein [Rhodobacterales bacterium]
MLCYVKESEIRILNAILVGLLGCGTPGSDIQQPPAKPELLPSKDRLIRASMVLRGVRPSVEDLDAITADPALYASLVDVYIESDEFGLTVRDIYAEALLVRTDVMEQLPVLGDISDTENLQYVNKATNESPLRLVEQIVVEDLPFTNIVTADWMWTDRVLAGIYGLPYDVDGPEWQKSWWSDGRPAAGLLVDSEIWRRHESAGSNFNRLRANFVSDTFLCDSFAGRDIAVGGGVDIADEFAVSNAVMVTPSCIGCHQAMDPLGSHFWGFKTALRDNFVTRAYGAGCIDWEDPEDPIPLPVDYSWGQFCYPLEHYTPADEQDWAPWNIRGPGYYGLPSRDLTSLGEHIADDPRFAMCAARRFTGYFTQTPKMDVPLEVAGAHRDVFVASGYSAKALAESIVLSDEFAVLRAPNASDVGLQVIRPEQYDRMIYALTGFRWLAVADKADCATTKLAARGTMCWGPVNLASSDFFGYRSSAGGVDGYLVVSPVHSPTPTKELIMARFAAEAAAFVVDSDLMLPSSQRRMLRLLQGDTWDEPMVRSQLVALHWQVLGVDVTSDDEAIDEYYELYFDRIARDPDPSAAWKLLIHALLRDPRVLFY